MFLISGGSTGIELLNCGTLSSVSILVSQHTRSNVVTLIVFLEIFLPRTTTTSTSSSFRGKSVTM